MSTCKAKSTDEKVHGISVEAMRYIRTYCIRMILLTSKEQFRLYGGAFAGIAQH